MSIRRLADTGNYVFPVFFTKNGATGDKHICAAFRDDGDCFLINTAIHLNQQIRTTDANRLLANLAHLRAHVLHKGLSAEARLHRHNQYHVDHGQVGKHRLCRGLGLDDQSCLCPLVLN